MAPRCLRTAAGCTLSNESLSTVDIIDTRTMTITKRIPLSGHPNNIAIHKNGRRAYVAITGAQGGVDVIDLVTEQRTKTHSHPRRCAQPVHHAG